MRFKKFISILLTVVLLFTLSLICVADFGTDKSINLGTDDTLYPNDPENDRRNHEKELESLIAPQGSGELAVSLSTYKQITGYYCGPASAYSVLRARNISVPSTTKNNVPFFKGCLTNCPYPGVTHTCVATYTSPQVTLADSMGTTPDGTNLLNIKNSVNNYLGSNYYACAYISGESDLISKISATLNTGYPLIVYVKAYKLDRYQNNTAYSGHYIVIYGYDSTNKSVYISDPNYNSKYGGKYQEDVSTLFNALYTGVTYNLIW